VNPVEVSDKIYTDIGEEWRLKVFGWRPAEDNQMLIQETRAVIVNYNKWFHYLFLSQDIRPIVYDRVNEKLSKRHREITEKYEDIKVTISRHGNKMVLSAVYDFINDEKDIKARSAIGDAKAYAFLGALAKRLRFLMEESSKMVSALIVETVKVENNARKELDKPPLSYLNRDEFVLLIDDEYEELTVKEGPEEGCWDFPNEETGASYEIYNFGDRLVFSINEQMPATTSEEQRDEIINQVDALVAKKNAKGANAMEVLRHPEDTNYVWVRANYALDGRIKGKELAKYYTEFKNKYAKDFHKKILDVFKEYEKAAEKVVKDLQNKKYSFITEDEYMLIADDALEGDLDPAEGVQEGH